MDYFNKSERQSFLKLLLSGGLYMLFGNILCAIMTLSSAPFIGNDFMKVIIFILFDRNYATYSCKIGIRPIYFYLPKR